MRKSKKLKNKISQALYHNSNVQRAAVDLKKSLDEICDILNKKPKMKKK